MKSMAPLIQLQLNYRRSDSGKKRSKMEVIDGLKSDDYFDASGKTVDADVSYRSGDPSLKLPAKVVGDTSCLADRQLQSCMKVVTQRDSLSRIASRETTSPKLEPIRESRRVQFHTVQFREYHRALSDNPSPSSGAPIGIGWQYDPQYTFTQVLDEYEADRAGFRRMKRELAIPPDVREEMLRDAGYPRAEIVTAARLARKYKERRVTSVNQVKFDPIMERVDAVRHGVRRMIPTRRLSSSDSQ